MLICINPGDPDQIWINPAQVVDIRPLQPKPSTKNPKQTVWVFTVTRSDGQSTTTKFDKQEDGQKVQDQFFDYFRAAKAILATREQLP